ncbi:MAG: hypothetical protein CM15mP83_5310 [Flavobacteriaceae bacterium]|nr:MAG: hypothetical protein CM15mP83_5310 [Flavobacteriaceae bacterium]
MPIKSLVRWDPYLWCDSSKGIDEVNAQLDSVSALEKVKLLKQMGPKCFHSLYFYGYDFICVGSFDACTTPNVESAIETNIY